MNIELHYEIFNLAYLSGKIHLGAAYRIDKSALKEIKNSVENIAAMLSLNPYVYGIGGLYDEKEYKEDSLKNLWTLTFLREYSYYVGCIGLIVKCSENICLHL